MKVFAATLLTLGPNPMAIATKTHRLGDNHHRLAKSSKSKSDKIPKGNVSPLLYSVIVFNMRTRRFGYSFEIPLLDCNLKNIYVILTYQVFISIIIFIFVQRTSSIACPDICGINQYLCGSGW